VQLTLDDSFLSLLVRATNLPAFCWTELRLVYMHHLKMGLPSNLYLRALQ